MRRLLFLAVSAHLAACAEGSPGPDGGTSDGGTSDGGSDGGPDGGAGAILDDPVDPRFGCEVTHAPTKRTPRWTRGGHDLIASGGAFWLGRSETDADPFEPDPMPTTLVSTLEPTTTSSPTVLGAGAWSVALAGADDGWLAVSVVESSIRARRFSNGVLSAEVELASGFDGLFQPRAVRLESGSFLVTWVAARASGDTFQLYAHRVDGSGASLGGRSIATGSSNDLLPHAIAARAGGAAVVWLDSTGLRFAAIDADGQAGPTKTLATPSAEGGTFANRRPAIHATPEGFVVAYASSTFNQNWSDPVGRTWIELLRLDSAGDVVSGPRPLRAPRDHAELVEPELFTLHGRLGVLWSEGTIIYVCGGCVPNHDLRLVVLDPETLRPESAELRIEHDLGGGLLSHVTGAIGDRIAIASQVVYHVHAESVSAFLACRRR